MESTQFVMRRNYILVIENLFENWIAEYKDYPPTKLTLTKTNLISYPVLIVLCFPMSKFSRLGIQQILGSATLKDHSISVV